MQINIEHFEHVVLKHESAFLTGHFGGFVCFVGWLTEVFPAEMAEIMLSLSLHHLYVKISEMAGTIVVPGSRLCVADNQHCAGPGTYM